MDAPKNHVLDLTRHTINTSLPFTRYQVIKTIDQFRSVVNHDVQGPLYMESLAKVIDYATTTHRKTLDEYAAMRKIIHNNSKTMKKSDRDCQQALQDLTDAQEESMAKKFECERLQAGLNTVNTELAIERSKVEQRKQEIRTQRTEHARVLGELDDATSEIIRLRRQLKELRQQSAETGTTVAAQDYCPRGFGPRELLTGEDIRAYAPWEHGVEEKLHTDAVMYTDEKDRVNYALQQTTQPIFNQISSWTRANKDTLTIEQLFQEIKHYMGIHMLASIAKKKLNVIVMKNNESVTSYYHRIFTLWDDADTPMDERMDKLLWTMKPSISQPLLEHKYNTIQELLDAARVIECHG